MDSASSSESISNSETEIDVLSSIEFDSGYITVPLTEVLQVPLAPEELQLSSFVENIGQNSTPVENINCSRTSESDSSGSESGSSDDIPDITDIAYFFEKEWEEEMEYSAKLALRSINLNLVRLKLKDARTMPVSSVLAEIIEIFSPAFEVERSGSQTVYKLHNWAKSIAMGVAIGHLEEIFSFSKEIPTSAVYNRTVETRLDTLNNFIDVIYEVMRDKIDEDRYAKHGNLFEEMRFVLNECLDLIRKSNYRNGVRAGIFPDKLWPKLLGIENEADLIIKNAGEECALCKTEIISYAINFGILSHCCHVFCASCLERSFMISAECPLCRVVSDSWMSRDRFHQLKSAQSQPEDPVGKKTT